MSSEKERTGKVRDIEERTFQFALDIVRLCQTVEKKAGTARILTLQLLRSVTSVGANVEEAQAGQSRADFISKYSVALKESRETRYWLRLMAESQIINSRTVGPLLKEAIQLSRILVSIVSRSKQVR
ncbi:MAG: four helix bundle protein [Nitrospirota bacterium]|nr:four helix bundle protein [Nitrospirota bacterium]